MRGGLAGTARPLSELVGSGVIAEDDEESRERRSDHREFWGRGNCGIFLGLARYIGDLAGGGRVYGAPACADLRAAKK